MTALAVCADDAALGVCTGVGRWASPGTFGLVGPVRTLKKAERTLLGLGLHWNHMDLKMDLTVASFSLGGMGQPSTEVTNLTW